MILETGKTYSAQIDLNFIQRVASNERVKKEFEGMQFKEVFVTGEGKTRFAHGIYTGKTREMPEDKRISSVQLITL